MVKLNNFFKAYGNFDVNDGTLAIFSEVAGKDGCYKGYVKPVIQNLDISGKEDKQDSFLTPALGKVCGSGSGTGYQPTRRPAGDKNSFRRAL
jgi:hypothetical protein